MGRTSGASMGRLRGASMGRLGEEAQVTVDQGVKYEEGGEWEGLRGATRRMGRSEGATHGAIRV